MEVKPYYGLRVICDVDCEDFLESVLEENRYVESAPDDQHIIDCPELRDILCHVIDESSNIYERIVLEVKVESWLSQKHAVAEASKAFHIIRDNLVLHNFVKGEKE